MNEFDMYLSGMSIPEVSEKTGVSRSTIRLRMKAAGILRTRQEGIKIAASVGKLGSGMRGKKRVFTDQWKENIRESKKTHGEQSAKGFRVTSSGYAEFTRGDYKGRLVHCVVMESRIGRKLYIDERVHHIDGDKLNNHADNLALLTKSGHARLHNFEFQLSENPRERNKNGTWS